MHRRGDPEDGSALIFALGFMVVVLIIALGVHTLVGRQLQASGALRQRVTAEYLAEGGVARAIGWFSAQGYLLPQASSLTTTVPVQLTADNKPVVLPSNHPDSYIDLLGESHSGVVSSFNMYLTAQPASGGTYSVTASLINAHPETWELLASGQEGAARRQVGALISRPQDPLFPRALFGRDSVALNSAYVDSYDSSFGTYGGANRSQSGNVGSNGTIYLNGNATVAGDTIPGPNQSVVQSGGNNVVTGSTTPAQAPRTLAPVTTPLWAQSIPAINLSGHAVSTLTAGMYVVGSLSISGQAQLIIDASAGPVYLFVTGPISVGGNGISNNSGLPQNLNILEVGSASVQVSGGSDFYGTIYAPTSAVAVSGNGQLYGAVVGATLSVNGNSNAAIHYDQHLRTIPGPPGPFKLVELWMLPS